MYQNNWGYSQTPQNNLLFVNNRLSAELYNMPPNSKIILMDNEEDKFYLKETDAAGFGTVKTYRFEEVIEEQPVSADNNYITREEFEKWKEEYEQLKDKQQQQPKLDAITKF